MPLDEPRDSTRRLCVPHRGEAPAPLAVQAEDNEQARRQLPVAVLVLDTSRACLLLSRVGGKTASQSVLEYQRHLCSTQLANSKIAYSTTQLST
jgi:hypothetical protein